MSTLLEQASLVLIPSGYKEDTVYSVIPSNGSGDMSFTRASDGTRINSDGLVEVCPWNLLTYSEQPTNAAWIKQNAGTTFTLTDNFTTAKHVLLQINIPRSTNLRDMQFIGASSYGKTILVVILTAGTMTTNKIKFENILHFPFI